MDFKRFLGKFFIFTAIVFFTAEVLWLGVAPFVLNHFIGEKFVVSKLNENDRIDAKIQNLSYKTYPTFSLGISAKLVDISHDKEKILSAKSVYTKLRILPLVFGKISLGRVAADDFQVKITRAKDGTFNIKNLFSYNKMKFFTPEFANFSAEFSDYEISLFDEYVGQNSFMSGNYLNVKKFVPDKSLELEGDGVLKALGAKSSFDLDIAIHLPFSKHFADNDFRLNGSISNFDFKTVSHYLPVDYKNYVGIISLSSNTTNSLNGKKLVLKARVKDFNTSLDNDDFKGISTVLNADLKFVGKGSEPDIFGVVELSDFKFLFNNKKSVLSHVVSKFDGKTVGVKMLSDFGFANLLTVEGHSDIYSDKNTSYKIKTVGNIDLAALRGMLISISNAFKLNMGILTDVKMDGVCKGDLLVGGTREKPYVTGLIRIYNSKILLKGLGGELRNSYGKMEFKGRDLLISTDRALLGSYPAKLVGKSVLNGPYDFTVSSDFVDMQVLFDVVKKCEFFKSIASNLSPIKKISGNSSFSLNFSVGEKHFTASEKPVSKYKIDLAMKGVTANIEGFKHPMTSIFGKLSLDENNSNFDIRAKMLNSFWEANGAQTLFRTKFKLTSKRTFLRDMSLNFVKDDFYKNLLSELCASSSPYINYAFEYDEPGRKVVPQKTTMKAFLYYKDDDGKQHSAGNIGLKNGNLSFNNIVLSFFNSSLKINGNVAKVFSKSPKPSLSLNFNNFDLAVLNDFRTLNFLSLGYKKIFSAYENYSGKLSGNVFVTNGLSRGKFSLSNAKFNHKRLQIPIEILNADLIFRHDDLNVKALNAKIDNIPLYVDLKVKDISKTPNYSGYLTSNIYPDFINKYVNANIGYPVKLKNEVRFKANFSGDLTKFKLNSQLSIPVGSDISYMGASLGEEDFERSIAANIEFLHGGFNIDEISYSKYILSQNNQKTIFPYFSLSGIIEDTPQGKFFRNFSLKTYSRCSSKFFNMIFKKSILKQGDFECDLNVNGSFKSPSVLGYLRFRNIDIPLYETVIKDIYADFKPSVIQLKTLGTIYDTNVEADAVLQNKLHPPHRIKSLAINADYLDLNKIMDVFSQVKPTISEPHITSSGFDLSSYFVPKNFLIDSGTVKASEILVKSFPAKNFGANFSLDDDAVLHISDVDFNMANGTFTVNGAYNFNNKKLSGDCIAKNVDANEFSQLVLNVKNQIYGNLDGTVDFSTSGSSSDERLKNLKGNVYFEINEGKMPKLGSLEYLLKAGNLVKSGVTGFTINNLIELIIPIKTGDFATIKGIISVVDGYAKNIQIYSRGENLSLYIKGESDLETSRSNMLVYGRLSKNFASLLGAVGNVSLNTLFNLIPGISIEEAGGGVVNDLNKIPGIELSRDNYRFFNAKIDGDLNGDNYVKSFKWFE